MLWALKKGNWNSLRLEAVNGKDKSKIFIPLPNIFNAGTNLPGVRRWHEIKPWRRTSRMELACLASWKKMLLKAEKLGEEWILLMEDDIGSSLSTPQAWPISLNQIINEAPKGTLAIQLAPISANTRTNLHQQWRESGKKKWLVPKEKVKSHGNGSVLIHRKAFNYLIPKISKMLNNYQPNIHLITHPWTTRPVADKWIYASLPKETCQVLSYPIFCLDAHDSSLHKSHVNAYHLPSKEATIKIWSEDKHYQLLEAQSQWDELIKN